MRAQLNERCELQSLERLERLQSLESLESLERLQLSYTDVPIPPDATVYADPPYQNSGGYNGTSFDHEAFWQWVRSQPYPVFVSEYQAPEDFATLAEIPLISTLSSTSNSTRRIEKVFVHQRFADKYSPKTLF
jgi:hypothetical protein